MNDGNGKSRGHNEAGALYARMEERMMARDSKGASDAYYDLVRAKRPFAEIMGECVRIHAPYIHVPYHQRIDDGYPNFVNNDHCLLSARAALHLQTRIPNAVLRVLPNCGHDLAVTHADVVAERITRHLAA